MCQPNCKHSDKCRFRGTGYECDLRNDSPEVLCVICAALKAQKYFVKVQKETPSEPDPDYGF